MFDLPVETSTQRKAYRGFVKKIKGEGFVILQKSIYTKLLVNSGNLDKEIKLIKSAVPAEGMVSVLSITEKQFQTIENIIGEFANQVISSDERYIEL